MNSATVEPASPAPALNWKVLGAFCGLAVVTVILCGWGYRHQTIPEAGVSMDLPDRVGGFVGKDVEVSEGERVILPKDTEFAKKLYQDASGDQINCQIVLSGADKRSIHRPEICLPGQGWNTRDSRTISIPLASGRELKVTQLTLTRPHEIGGVRKPLTLLFLYWFVGGSSYTTHDHLQRILHSNLDMLLHNRAHRWAYVIVSAPVLQGFVPNGKSEAETFEMLKTFVPQIVPSFQKSEQSAFAPAPAKP